MSKYNDIHERLLRFGVRIVKICKMLSKNIDNRVIADQLIRAGTSVGANMQEADAAASKKDFINKVSIAKKESQETLYWLKIVKGTELIHNEQNMLELNWLMQESQEIILILGAILHKSRQ